MIGTCCENECWFLGGLFVCKTYAKRRSVVKSLLSPGYDLWVLSSLCVFNILNCLISVFLIFNFLWFSYLWWCATKISFLSISLAMSSLGRFQQTNPRRLWMAWLVTICQLLPKLFAACDFQSYVPKLRIVPCAWRWSV